MSSTNRGGKRTEADNYPTPPWCTWRLLERLGDRLPKGYWYEPCAGEGAIIQAAQHHGLEGVTWCANELREESLPVLQKFVSDDLISIGNCLDPSVGARNPDVIITNPPFSLAWDILHTSLRRWPRSHLVLLLRLNFWGSDDRHSFMKQFPPDTYVLPNRPDFRGQGKTDSIEYAWMHWGPSPRAREAGQIAVLDSTPLEERRSSMSMITFPE